MYSKCLDRSLKNNSSPVNSLVGLIDVSIQLGRKRQAEDYVAELVQVIPDFSLEGLHRIFPYKNSDYLELILANLEEAGLK